MQNLLFLLLFSICLSALPNNSIYINGYEFEIKQSEEPEGPGPNFFSSGLVSPISSGVKLETKFNPSRNRWEASEIILKNSLGHGKYRFKVSSNFSSLDPNTVIGVFFYDDHNQNEINDMHEIDILEISKWKSDRCRGQSVQHDYRGMLCSYEFDIKDYTSISCEVDWKPQLMEVNCIDSLFGEELISAKYYRDLPHLDVANFRVNLWIFRGDHPFKSDYLIFEDFGFTPYNSNSSN